MVSPKVYGLGSCRIHTPLRRAAQHQGLRYRRNTAIEFYHNTAEIRQMASFLAGQQDLLFALSVLLAAKHPLALFEKRAEDFQYFREADVYVVEISSIKLCLYRQHQLQLVHLRDFLNQMAELDEAKLNHLYEEPSLARTIKLPVVDTDQQWLAQDILETAEFSIQNATDLEADLRRLHTQLGKPVLYVSHFVHLPNGDVLPQRALIRDTLARLVPTLEGQKAAFFDPTPLTSEGGYAANLIDYGHYTEAMDLQLGKKLAAEIQSLFD